MGIMNLVGRTIYVPTENATIKASPLCSELARRKVGQVRGRRRSMIHLDLLLHYDQCSAVDELESTEEVSRVPKMPPFMRQSSHSSDPLPDLGDLAFMIMPPKIVKDDVNERKQSFPQSRRLSCTF